jgi:hypothetical protein
MIGIMALVLVISICFLAPKAAAQSDKYSKMAPVGQYLMERNAEVLLALRTFSVDDAEHFLHNHHASVASLRNAVRLPSGIDVHLHRNAQGTQKSAGIGCCFENLGGG